MSEDKVQVSAEAVGIRKDSHLIFKLRTKDHGDLGPEKAKELGLDDYGYEYGEWDDYMPVVEEEADEPIKTRGFINENQPIKGELNV